MTYEKRAECSLEVQEMIRIANLIPGDTKAPLYFGEFIKLNSYESWEDRAKVIKLWYKSLADYPDILEFLDISLNEAMQSDPDASSLDISERAPSYVEFSRIRELLSSLVSISDEIRSNLTKGFVQYKTYTVNTPFVLLEFGSKDTMTRAGFDGRIRFEVSHYLECLQRLEIQRIRRCQICRNIFWARKNNAETCQKKCRDTLGNQKRKGKSRPQSNRGTSGEISQDRIDRRKQFLAQDFGKRDA